MDKKPPVTPDLRSVPSLEGAAPPADTGAPAAAAPTAAAAAAAPPPDPDVKPVTPKQAEAVRALHEAAQEAEVELANAQRMVGQLVLQLDQAKAQAEAAQRKYVSAVEAREQRAAKIVRSHNVPIEQWLYDIENGCVRRRPFLPGTPLQSPT